MEKKQNTLLDFIFFLVPSCLGLYLFMTPITVNGESDIPVGFLAKKILAFLSNPIGGVASNFSYVQILLLVVFSFSFVMGLLSYILPKGKVYQKPALLFFHIPKFWFAVRSLGYFITVCCLFKIGPEVIWRKDTGTFLLTTLIPFLFCLFICAGFLLPLLIDFGLLEFFGVFLTKIMRPLFTLPGRSSIDCLSSWVGDGSVAIILTNKQYEEGFYSKREATVIATTFSFVSITFCFSVLSHAKLQHLAGPYYLTILISGLVAAIICPRVPPLSWIEDSYFTKKAEDEVKASSLHEMFTIATNKALSHARKSASLTSFLKKGFMNVAELWTGVLTPIMTFGTISLIIAKYTPVFEYIGMLFYPLLLALQVPEALEASQAVVLGFSDMFLPVIVTGHIKSDFTRFVIATLSVSQLIFMSEAGALLLTSKMNIRFRDLVAIFILRTLITLPIIVFCAHFIF